MRILSCGVVCLACLAVPAIAEDLPQPEAASPGVIVQGSGDVAIGGQSAARAGDATSTGNVVVEGSPDVFINGKPAGVQGRDRLWRHRRRRLGERPHQREARGGSG